MAKVTVGQALEDGRNTLRPVSDSPSLDSQRVLSEILDRPRPWLIAHPEAPLQATQHLQYLQDLERLSRGIPLPYILGWQEFFGRRFDVSEAVLIPRPDTECLVEVALALLAERAAPARVLDAGTGSGCIAVTLAAERPHDQVVALDLSAEALQVARRNAVNHGVHPRITFVRGYGLGCLRGPFDLVCANLPYVPTGLLKELPVAQQEPLLALDGGDDGFSIIRLALAELPDLLISNGCGLFEIAADQGPIALNVVDQVLPGWHAAILPDLAGRDRVLRVERETSV